MRMNATGSFLILLATIAGATRAQDEGEAAPKPIKYAVVQTDDQASVVEASQVDELKKKVAADYAAATKAWQDAKKAAQKNKTPFTDKKPTQAKVKVVANNLPSKEAAEAALEKLQAKAKKAAAKPAREKDDSKKKDKDG